MDLETFIQIFHRWIQEDRFDELLIDVADYRHVPEGPGVVLVAHEADYSMDETGGRLGLLYRRKSPEEGSNLERLGKAAESALAACKELESEPSLNGKLTFNRDELEVSISDRALAPNTEETYAALKPELEDFFSKFWGNSDFTISFEQGDPRGLFRVQVKSERNLSGAVV